VLLYTLLIDIISLSLIQNLFSEDFSDTDHEVKCLFPWELYMREVDS